MVSLFLHLLTSLLLALPMPIGQVILMTDGAPVVIVLSLVQIWCLGHPTNKRWCPVLVPSLNTGPLQMLQLNSYGQRLYYPNFMSPYELRLSC